MASWPPSLPQTPRISGYSQTEKSGTIRSPMGYGPDKTRRRTTATIQPVTCSLILTDAQKTALIAFYNTDTVNGAVSFDWVDHLNGGAASYRFLAPISWASAGCNLWLAGMSLEILP